MALFIGLAITLYSFLGPDRTLRLAKDFVHLFSSANLGGN